MVGATLVIRSDRGNGDKKFLNISSLNGKAGDDESTM